MPNISPPSTQLFLHLCLAAQAYLDLLGEGGSGVANCEQHIAFEENPRKSGVWGHLLFYPSSLDPLESGSDHPNKKMFGFYDKAQQIKR